MRILNPERNQREKIFTLFRHFFYDF